MTYLATSLKLAKFSVTERTAVFLAKLFTEFDGLNSSECDNITMKLNCGSMIGIVTGCAIFLYVGTLLLIEVSKHQAEPYMDEIFHIPQAQKYCVGRYSEVKM